MSMQRSTDSRGAVGTVTDSLAAILLRCAPLSALVTVILASGCDHDFDAINPILRMDYVNNTDSVLCRYTSTHSDRTRCGEALQPHTTTVLLQDCYDSAWNILDEESTGAEIYFRVARCEEWFEAGHTITVDRVGDEFVITDGFGDPPEEP